MTRPALRITDLQTRRLVLRRLDPVAHADDLFVMDRVLDAPRDQPWGRRAFTLALAEGHRLTVSGATTPDSLSQLV